MYVLIVIPEAQRSAVNGANIVMDDEQDTLTANVPLNATGKGSDPVTHRMSGFWCEDPILEGVLAAFAGLSLSTCVYQLASPSQAWPIIGGLGLMGIDPYA